MNPAGGKTIREREDELFERWRNRVPNLVPDGLVGDSFRPGCPKILFILKEPNDPEGTLPDIRDFLREGAQPETWGNIARWVAGIERLPAETLWADVAKLTADRRKSLLCTIAAMNLKKSPGGGSRNATA